MFDFQNKSNEQTRKGCPKKAMYKEKRDVISTKLQFSPLDEYIRRSSFKTMDFFLVFGNNKMHIEHFSPVVFFYFFIIALYYF